MILRTRYSQEDDVIRLSTSEKGDGSYDVESDCWAVIDVPVGGGYRPVALELMFVSRLLPLENNGGYCSEIDTLVIGEGQSAATLVEENDDLAAYWCSEEGPDDLILVAVSLRNASKHLAPAIRQLEYK